jgi:hypothetical protein
MRKNSTTPPNKPAQLAKEVRARRPELRNVLDLFIWESFRASFPWLVDAPYSPGLLASLFCQDKRACDFALALAAAAEKQRSQQQKRVEKEK